MSLKDKIGIISENLYTLEQNLKRVDAKPSTKVLILNKDAKELFHGERRELKGVQLQSKVKSLNKSINKDILVYVMMEERKQGNTSKDKIIDEHVIVAQVPNYKENTKVKSAKKIVPRRERIVTKTDMTQRDFVSIAKQDILIRVAFSNLLENETLEEKDKKITQSIIDTKPELLAKNSKKSEWGKNIWQSQLTGVKVRLFSYDDGMKIIRVKHTNNILVYYLLPKEFKVPTPPIKVKAGASRKYTATQNTARLNLAKRIVQGKINKSRPQLQGINVRNGIHEFTDSYQLYQLRNEDLLVDIPKELYIDNKKYNYPDLEKIITQAKQVEPIVYNVKALKQLIKESSVIKGSNFSTKYVKIKGTIGDTLVDEKLVKNVIKMLGLKDSHEVTVYNRSSSIRPVLIENKQGSIAIVMPTKSE